MGAHITAKRNFRKNEASSRLQKHNFDKKDIY